MFYVGLGVRHLKELFYFMFSLFYVTFVFVSLGDPASFVYLVFYRYLRV